MNTLKKLKIGFVSLLLPLTLCLLNADFALAQATIAVSGTSATITRTGYTESLGSVTFTVAEGTTVGGNLEFFVPNATFSDTSGIALVGTGVLATATITNIVPSNGIVEISIPAGAVAGATLTLNGVRVSAVGATFTTLNAAISATGNSIPAGENLVPVLSGIADGLAVDTSAGNTLTISNGVVTTMPGAFKAMEGWIHSFSGAIGVNGQTAQTQLIFQVIGLPDGVSLTFPALVFSDSGDGATIQTLSGGPQTLTNQSTTNRVVYQFYDSATSSNVFDSFSVTPTLGFNGQPGNGTAYIQVALGPIGALVPDTQYPSTAIPRFAELFLPPPTPVQLMITTLALPVISTLTNDSFSLSNTASGGAVITATARREDGTANTDVTNPATINLAGQQTSPLSLTDLFGSSATTAKIAAVELTFANAGVVANSIGTIQGERIGIAAPPVEQRLTYVPFERSTSSDVPVLTVQNATDADIPTSITLFSSNGSSVATATPTVSAHGALRQDLASLFPSATVPLDGYVSVQGTGPLRTILLNHPNTAPEDIPSLTETSDSPQTFPFFVIGGGYDSVLTLINTSSNTAVQLSLTPYTPAGLAIVPHPFTQMIAPGQKQTFDFDTLFGQAQVLSGYVVVNLDSTLLTPFSSRPTVAGTVRLSASSSRAVVPFFSNPATQLYMTPAVETSDSYTGISVFNPTGNPVIVTFDAFASTGMALGTATVTIPAGLANVQLLRQLISNTVGNDNMLVRITASANISVLGLRGTFSGSELIYLRGETLPQ